MPPFAQAVALDGGDVSALVAMFQEAEHTTLNVRYMKTRLAVQSATALKKIIAEYLAFIADSEGLLLGLRGRGAKRGQFLVERTAQGRVDPWPLNGLNSKVVDRFLSAYYWSHTGKGAHERPCLNTIRTVERWLHCAALRRCKFDANHKKTRYNRASGGRQALSPILRRMSAVWGEEFTAPRINRSMILAADVDVLLNELDKPRDEACVSRWYGACGAAGPGAGRVGPGAGRGGPGVLRSRRPAAVGRVPWPVAGREGHADEGDHRRAQLDGKTAVFRVCGPRAG